MTPQDKAADKRLRKTYGITLDEYNGRLETQGGRCKICGRLPGKVRLHVDHDHAVDKVKVVIKKYERWVATATYKETTYTFTGDSKSSAKISMIQWLRRDSVRGLLCLRCNKGIQMFEDSKAPLSPAERFGQAQNYFKEFEDGKTGRSFAGLSE